MNLEAWHQRYRQQASWTQAMREYLFNKIGLSPGDQLLEVGSGTGAIIESLSQTPAYHLTGIDIELPGLRFTRRSLPQSLLAVADGHHLPFRNNVFSIAYCHYLLMWVDDPMRIIREMQRVTRSGGWVMALAESDHAGRIDYPPPLDDLGHLQTRALGNQGVDIKMGRKLRSIFNQSDLDEVESGILGAQWRSKADHSLDEIEWAVVHSDLDDTLSKDKLARFQDADQSAHLEGSRVLFIPTFYAIGRVK